ncbi:DNA topoisomerase 2-alpha-like isoform X2 [Gigantopelta aegis]|uniref:DNA topoisomerase 2-alpha-like isoform X2 n=1 Tax=Gigantopelta aegis TaxID=1735272 RepID=UPI001B88B8D0|nr:DNA topoisomerase 2-alpha-like isoform X2 [Gigantopelta aegis]
MTSTGPLKAMFENMQAKTDKAIKKSKSQDDAPVAPPDGHREAGDALSGGDAKHKGSGKSAKRLSVERIYQKKTQLEHILLRPDTYIGSVESVTQMMWVMDEDQENMIQREITFVPGLYKIFDEILVNAADNKQRDPGMNCIKIDIDSENNKIKIWNNGKGIPVVEHKTEKMFVPTMIFGHLLTSSNYDDTERKVTGGRNGYGAKLCNIFSTKFIVETSCKEYHKCFKQTWIDNMSKTKDPTIGDSKEHDFTSVTFFPDLTKFKMASLNKDTVALFSRRAYDIAATSKGVKVFLNGKKIPVKNFKDYVDLYIKNKNDEAGAPLKLVHENPNDRWEVAVTLSDKGFQQASFVNSIATTKGGRHVDYVTDQLVTKLIDIVKRKNKGGINIKPFQVKSHMWIFVNCLVENPTFDSQTKENMTLQAKSFGSRCQLSEKFITQVSKCGIIESILSWMKFKAQAQLNKKCHASKHSKLRGIPKLDDANDAGTKNSLSCTLILTEGDSAKTLAVAGLGIVGRDRYGVFPLRGKVLNVREASHKQIMDNAEINNIVKIMGLQFKEKYDSPDSIRSLRYGKIMIMTDQDQDGSHIKGLLINFIHHFWPNLLKHNVVEQFITPIVKVSKSKTEHSFYSMPEFEEWKNNTDNWHTWKVKYYKGLGTSTAKEAKEYFSDMERHRILFKYAGAEDDSSIQLAFSKKKIEERKEWLTNWMEDRKRRSEMGLPELYLYGKDTKRVVFNEFINRELILFSNMDNVRSIPSLVDGFKPGQRKVIFACFKRNLVKEIKVAQLAGSVSEIAAYHHGEVSLMGTIINLAQNFVGSNNLNLLLPIGQFGTRLHGGKDAASPRYIFTSLSKLARLVFNIHDDPLLKANYDDSLRVEPEWYCPILPMVLVNGAEGIGTGWSTKIPNFDVREIVANLKRLLDGLDALPMITSYKNFKGTIEELSENRYVVSGEISIIDDNTLEISELPIRSWTQNYKEEVLEPMLHGTDKTPSMITDYKEYHTDTTVKFTVKMDSDKLTAAEHSGLHKVFKLQTTISTNSMVLFDHNGCIRRFQAVEEILKEFYEVRLDMYKKRKAYLDGMLAAESLKLDNIARFILEKIEGTIVIENKTKKDIIQMLVRKGYDSDPVKAWKDSQDKEKNMDDDDEADDAESSTGGGPDFNYILSMPLWNLTKERKDELCKQRDAKARELQILRGKTYCDLWKEDLERFLEMLDEVEQQEREDNIVHLKSKVVKGKSGKPRKIVNEVMPSPLGIRVEPRIDSGMKIKAEKDAARKLKKGKKTLKFDGDGESQPMDVDVDVDVDDIKQENGDDEPKSLAERIGVTVKKMIPKAKTGPATTKAPRPKTSPKKKKKVFDSDVSISGASDLSDVENGDTSFAFIPRERAVPRRAAATTKVKYFDSDDEVVKSESEQSFKPVDSDVEIESIKEKPADTKPVPVKQPDRGSSPVITADFSDTDSDAEAFSMKTFTTNTVSQPSSKSITFDDSSDGDMFASSKKEPEKPKLVEKKTKKPAAKKAKKADPKQPSISTMFSKPSKLTKFKSSAQIELSDDDDIIALSPEKETSTQVKKPRKKTCKETYLC